MPPYKIRYLSSTPGARTGMVGVSYKVDGKLKSKSASWHYQGRSEQEAIKLLENFRRELKKEDVCLRCFKVDEERSTKPKFDSNTGEKL